MNNILQDFINELFEGKDYSWILDTETNIMYFNPKEVLIDCGYSIRGYEDRMKKVPENHRKFFTNKDLIQHHISNVGLKLNNYGQVFVTIYALIRLLDGKKRKATETTDWLTYEVLPAIDKQGYYISKDINQEQIEELKHDVLILQEELQYEKSQKLYTSKEITSLINIKGLLSTSIYKYLDELKYGEYKTVHKNRRFSSGDKFKELIDKGYVKKYGNSIIFTETFAEFINDNPDAINRLKDINIEEQEIRDKGIENKTA